MWQKSQHFSPCFSELSHWALPGGAGAWETWKFSETVAQQFTSAKVGDSFGPTWSTHWFRLQFSVPDEWAGYEVRLRWNSNSEAALWNSDGQMLQVCHSIPYFLCCMSRCDFKFTILTFQFAQVKPHPHSNTYCSLHIPVYKLIVEHNLPQMGLCICTGNVPRLL